MLQEFGFTQYESKVYQALIAFDQPMDATTIVKQSGVPRAKVYEVLHRLSEKGMILEATTEKKRVYSALPVEMTIEKLKADFEANIERLKAAKTRQTPKDDRVWTLKEDRSIQASLREMMRKANQSIFISGWEDDIQANLDVLEEKNEAGLLVNIHVIGEINTNIPGVSTLIPDTHHEALERSRVLIVDEEEMLFAGVEDEKWQAIQTQSGPLVKFFTEFFYHDVALTEITQKYKDTIMKDEEIKEVLLKLRY
ncbi:TrmB family transcriptional regulator [Thalassobacillus devorans]|uniref:TrmB family transcriptional regulator n=1 Tax=Thalassobacillus devorans TaxID=279813 RepID=UPI000A1C7F32|nr:TrmB family transcriptional regulator [Thalassobacillus devorans]